jgi:hypothetical protein
MLKQYCRKVVLGLELLASGNVVTALQNWRRRRRGALRVLYPRPLVGPAMEWSPRRINAIARRIRAQRYLEIGVLRGHTAQNIRVHSRVGVDPMPLFDTTILPNGFTFFRVESDSYFLSIDPKVKFDIVFLDGLHTFEQTRSDLFNALEHLSCGVVLIDDTFPSDEIAAMPDLEQSRALRPEPAKWMGDVWKLVVYIDAALPQLDFRTIVGRGNVQTLVWHVNGEKASPSLGTSDQAESIAQLDYSDYFRNGIPAQFRPCSEAEAIRACLRAVMAQRLSTTAAAE